ncbi:hypothetical protein [Dorea sp. Marseille-P4042]|uniref:hypothetical protein n=1 Tax=Dorea sp. Marseille-P4042 TaxID=2080749 RepID=UPI000CFA326D|nr:hypothetical protein [Dorea sp. Marseille-P4042]
MKYKVGDKVKVRSDLKCEEYYGGVLFASEMNRFKGMEFTITRVNNGGYYEVLEVIYNFTDEMLEPVEEMSAEEAIKIQAEMCKSIMCKDCAIDRLRCDPHCECAEYRSKNPDKVLEIIKQWKKDHEKKEVETERAIMVRVLVGNDCNGKCVHEEEVPSGETWERAQERVLKEYCENHEGKYISTICGICRVKE